MSTHCPSIGWRGKSAARVPWFGSLTLVFFACLAGMAAASDQASASPRSGDLFSSKARFHCAPSPLGNGTLPKWRSNAAGTVAWWYCPGVSGKWSLNVAAATAAHLSVNRLWDEIYRVMTASDSVAAFHAVVAERVTVTMDDPSLKPVWQPFWSEMHAGAPAFVVKPSSAVAAN